MKAINGSVQGTLHRLLLLKKIITKVNLPPRNCLASSSKICWRCASKVFKSTALASVGRHRNAANKAAAVTRLQRPDGIFVGPISSVTQLLGLLADCDVSLVSSVLEHSVSNAISLDISLSTPNSVSSTSLSRLGSFGPDWLFLSG